MHELPPLPDDSEQLFLRSDAAAKSAVGMLIGGAAAGGLMSLFIFSLGILQLCGWDLDLDSKGGKVAVKRFGAGQ